MANFYFDFRNVYKQGLRDLVPSLLTQLSARSSPRCDILSDLYSVHDSGKKKPSDNVLTRCLKDILALPGQRPVYLILDALDESPNTSGIPSARESILLKELVDLGLPNFDIVDYVRSVVYSNSDRNMKMEDGRWKIRNLWSRRSLNELMKCM
jgi:hypothetical protein